MLCIEYSLSFFWGEAVEVEDAGVYLLICFADLMRKGLAGFCVLLEVFFPFVSNWQVYDNFCVREGEYVLYRKDEVHILRNGVNRLSESRQLSSGGRVNLFREKTNQNEKKPKKPKKPGLF